MNSYLNSSESRDRIEQALLSAYQIEAFKLLTIFRSSSLRKSLTSLVSTNRTLENFSIFLFSKTMNVRGRNLHFSALKIWHCAGKIQLRGVSNYILHLFRRVILYAPLFFSSRLFSLCTSLLLKLLSSLEQQHPPTPKAEEEIFETTFTFTQWFEKRLKMIKKSEYARRFL